MSKHSIITDISPELHKLQNTILSLRQLGKLEIQNGDLGYATAPSNIALLKYWGKVSNREQIPVNSSVSFTIGGFRSFTKVTALGRFHDNQNKQIGKFENKIKFSQTPEKKFEPLPTKMERLVRSIFTPFAEEISLQIETFNNFPSSCGIASSASGYAALVGAIADLLQLEKHFSPNELHTWLTEWARLGSGSATRSALFAENNSFTLWNIEESSSSTAYTTTLKLEHSEDFNKLQHCVFILSEHEKTISSSEGHKYAHSSPLQAIRIAGIPNKIEQIKKALNSNDFETLKFLSEEDAFAMHAVMQTGSPPSCYLDHEVAHAIQIFIRMRSLQNAKAFWTLDAGPNVHILFMPEEKDFVQKYHDQLQQEFKKDIRMLVNSFQKGLLLGRNLYKTINPEKILQTKLI